MIRFGMGLLISLLTCAVQAFTWHDLWLTPDQQGQKLMQQGKFDQAKQAFVNKDWAASASYKAGDYAQAVKLFEESHTYYNLGNALAHAKQYKEAIKAYDKALALNPDDKDAVFNRKLIQDLLKNQNKQQNKDQQNKDKQDQDKQDQDKQDQDKQDKDKQDQDKQDKDKQDKDKQDKDKQDKDKQDKDKQDKDKQDKDKQDKDKQDKDKQDKDKQDKAKQSEADREKQQAKEQWLQLVPDDPGGLMREKFLRDHLRRESGWSQ